MSPSGLAGQQCLCPVADATGSNILPSGLGDFQPYCSDLAYMISKLIEQSELPTNRKRSL